MPEVTAVQVRRDAVQRLVDLAADGDAEQYDIETVIARSEAREILRRRVWRRRRGDIAALNELERIWPLVQGKKEALIDCVHAGGLDPTAPPVPTIDDLERALASWQEV